MRIRIRKLHADVIVPSYAHPGDAGLDVFSREDVTLASNERHIFALGFEAELPDGTVALVWDKSGLASKKGLKTMAGVIDASYRGEWFVTLHNTDVQAYQIRKGDKIAQILIQKVERAVIEESRTLQDSERASGTMGSSGR